MNRRFIMVEKEERSTKFVKIMLEPIDRGRAGAFIWERMKVEVGRVKMGPAAGWAWMFRLFGSVAGMTGKSSNCRAQRGLAMESRQGTGFSKPAR